MTHYIKLQFLERSGGKYAYEALGDAYLEALELLNASIANAYDAPILFEDGDEDGFRQTTSQFENIFEYISSKLYNGEIIYQCVQVNFQEFNDNELDFFLENFLSLLRDEVQFLWKFHDTRELDIRSVFFHKIYLLEMDLREVLSYIFFKTYFKDKDLLSDIQLSKFNRGIQELENDFFDVSFSAYKELLNLKKLKDEDRERYLQESNSFDDWKNKLLNRGIQEEVYRDFISSISDELGTIEEFRNCIMHNRGYNRGLYENFETNFEAINSKISVFKSLHMNESGNELDLIIGKLYECVGDILNFIKGRKYPLAKIAYSDAVFYGEDGNEHVFLDKEFYMYWKE